VIVNVTWVVPEFPSDTTWSSTDHVGAACAAPAPAPSASTAATAAIPHLCIAAQGTPHHEGVRRFERRLRREPVFASTCRKGVARSLEKARAEPRKCVLLCANCHAEVEAGVLGLP
jgi:hypothetical protein